MKGFLANCEIVAFSLTPDNSAVGLRIRNNCRGKKMKKIFQLYLVLDCGVCYTKVKVTQSCPTLCNPTDYTVLGFLQARILSLLQGIFLTQGSNPGLPYCRRMLYQLSHKGSTRILEWVAYSFSSWSSQPRNQTGVFCIAGRFFTNWATREALSTLQFTLYL